MDTIVLIDTKIQEMKLDVAVGVTSLNELLISLAKEQWEAKKKGKNLKTSYDIAVINKKSEREEELRKWEGKITDAELTRYAERELVEDYRAYKEQEAIADYLTPILEAYINYVNGIKFDSKEWQKIERFNQ